MSPQTAQGEPSIPRQTLLQSILKWTMRSVKRARGFFSSRSVGRVIRFGLDAAPCKSGLMTSRNVSQLGNYNSVRRFKIALQSGWQR